MVLPKEVREKLGVEAGNEVVLQSTTDTLSYWPTAATFWTVRR